MFVSRTLNFLLNKYRILKYFLIPNIFTSAKCSYTKIPKFQQRTVISGVGNVSIGKNCGFGYKKGGYWRNGCLELQTRYKEANIIIGDHVHANNNLFICAANKIIINNYTRIGQNVCIMDFEAHSSDPLKRSQIGEIGEVKIEENVWIGNNVTILKNSTIGKNSIIATGSVVIGVFPENVIIGGIPAKVIKKL